MSKSTAPLTPLMLAALQTAEAHGTKGHRMVSVLTHQRTFAALKDRELIDGTGRLTEAGLQIHAKANPAPVIPPAVTAVPALPEALGGQCEDTVATDTSEELKLAGLRTMGSEQLTQTLLVATADGDLDSVKLVERVINERLEQEPAPAPESTGDRDFTHGWESTGDRYFTHGCGADVKARDAEIMHSMCTVDGHDGCITLGDFGPEQDTSITQPMPGHSEDVLQMVGRVERLPQRVPAEALTEELTGEPVDIGTVPVGTARPGYRPSVLLRPVSGEVVERATRETFVAVGAEWGRLEGRRVRIACMDGDVFHQRPLMIVEASATEPGWLRPDDRTVHMPRALRVGSTVLVDACRVYQVGGPYHVTGDAPVLRIVR